MKAFAILVAVCLLAACQNRPVVQPDPPDASCAAEGLQHLVGQPESVISDLSPDGPFRVIHPGQAVTMDFNMRRLNFEIDAAGRIDAVRCG